MRLSVAQLLTQLGAEGLLPPGGENAARAALKPEVDADLPWYMRAAVALGAWVATTFFLGMFFAMTHMKSEIAIAISGVLLMGAGAFVRNEAEAEFARWVAVAVALAGHVMVVGALATMGTDSALRGSLACIASAIVLIWLVPDSTLRFILTLSGAGAVIVALIALEIPYGFDIGIAIVVAAAAWVWRGNVRARGDDLADILEPVGYGLIVVLFAALLARTLATSAPAGHSFASGELGREIGDLGALATVASTAALVALVWKVLDEHGAPPSAPESFAALAGAVALGAVTLDSPGLVAGVAALMLAFDRRNRVLLGMAVLFLVVFGSFYYSSLHITLLAKSGVLVGSGLLLLGVRGKVVRA